jgi:hypothetical protein
LDYPDIIAAVEAFKAIRGIGVDAIYARSLGFSVEQRASWLLPRRVNPPGEIAFMGGG